MSAAWNPMVDPFLDALRHGRHKEFLALTTQVVKTSADLPTLYVEIIQPAMYRIGDLWKAGTISVAQEHLATSIVARTMASLYSRLDAPEPTKPKAVVTGTPNELHEIGARMVADLLELDGWDVTYLGANTPERNIVGCAIYERAHLLALSTAMPFNIDVTKRLIGVVKQTPELQSTRIMVGGSAYAQMPDPGQIMGVEYASDAIAAFHLARNSWQSTM